jgi:hypothetical protein
MQRRIAKVMTGIKHAELGDRLHVMNARGCAGDILRMSQEGRGITAEWNSAFLAKVAEEKYDLVIFDPLYKLQSIGDENKAEDVKPVLHAFDKLAEATGAAVCYVHHMGKGFAGERQTIDRAAGSGAIARDYDACITLTRHVNDGLVVMETIARNYKNPEDTSIKWSHDTGCFELDDTPPQVRTFKNSTYAAKTMDAAKTTALALVEGGPIPSAEWDAGMREAGVSKNVTQRIKAELIKAGRLARSKKQGYGGAHYIGTPNSIAMLPAQSGGMERKA